MLDPLCDAIEQRISDQRLKFCLVRSLSHNFTLPKELEGL